ncbi:c-type cytochrome [Alteromonas sp. ASW11-19]|uniref:C-type cytochrome n=1 Tax=Alteromonas salexigens TaxID=2982530 RepID=A0ABT2VQS5_9ALTE|nr:c-type cytochrome [Alteromonas salexigens]MCU7554788.1 c-type cytochrome [Alteromonas salexigens]
MKVKTWLSMMAAALTVFAVQAQDMSEEAIAERIKPMGDVHVAGAASESAAAGGGGAMSGEDVYNQACVACHGAGVLGAPKLQVAADWQPRLDERGLDGIWQNALDGINAMPPRGTCGQCSDDEIKAAIEYMIEGI